MPFVTLTVRKPKSTEFKDKVFAAVHAALGAIGVPDTDRFQRVLELDAADFRYDTHYPDVRTTRADGFDPENVMVVFKETTWENWSFAGGRLLHT
jgi:hypothetical protein